MSGTIRLEGVCVLEELKSRVLDANLELVGKGLVMETFGKHGRTYV